MLNSSRLTTSGGVVSPARTPVKARTSGGTVRVGSAPASSPNTGEIGSSVSIVALNRRLVKSKKLLAAQLGSCALWRRSRCWSSFGSLNKIGLRRDAVRSCGSGRTKSRLRRGAQPSASTQSAAQELQKCKEHKGSYACCLVCDNQKAHKGAKNEDQRLRRDGAFQVGVNQPSLTSLPRVEGR